MTLEQYIQKLQNIIDNNPDAKNYVVVYSEDEDGVHHKKVWYTPAEGWWCEKNKEFLEDSTYVDFALFERAVCIN